MIKKTALQSPAKVKNRTNFTDLRLSEETLFDSGDQFFDSLLRDIDQAQQSILIETYIFKNDFLGERVTAALVRARARGVQIKMLVDGCGSPFFGTMTRAFDQAHIETRVYHPFPWHVWNWPRSVVRLPWLIKWVYLLLKIIRRNHRKVFLIDNTIAYIGSFNISKDHLSHDAGGNNWRDIGIKLCGDNFKNLNECLENCWHHRTLKEVIREAFQHIRKDPIVRLNNTGHRRRILYRHLIRRIRQAKTKIWITNAYFVPDNSLLRALKDAAKRKLDVRILLPHKSDTFLPLPWAGSVFYDSLLKAGVRIFEYLPSILHAKSFIIDDWVMVGSSNLDYLSLRHNLEIDIRLSKPKNIKKANWLFLDDLTKCREIAAHTDRPFYQRIIGRLLLYFKYFI